MGNGCEERRGPTWFRSLAEAFCVSLEVLLRLRDGPHLRWVRRREVVAAGDLDVLRAGGASLRVSGVCCMRLVEGDGERWGTMVVWEMEDGRSQGMGSRWRF
ncbi:hypothetical protein MRB53_028628 [Persea americana]|uniref:Uncharacterized protein n=1 Tax=Persea americana TaxID=3435 RepID=A0ACC2KGL1_PERAE|nr:hypothetical protein MRB53_028628 [Persea americana]